MNDPQNKLYVDLRGNIESISPEAALDSADGYLLSSVELPAGLDIDGKDVLFQDVVTTEPSELKMAVHGHTHICSFGLAETARLRAEFPDNIWIPKVEVTRLETAYHFPTTHYSESFRTYQPVFPPQSPYRVSDGDEPVGSWLKMAGKLGFETVWLHANSAAVTGTGLDLDLRELALKTWQGNLWLSGGAQTIMHIKYLVQEGGLDALVISPDLANSLGCDQIRASLQWGVKSQSSEIQDMQRYTEVSSEEVLRG